MYRLTFALLLLSLAQGPAYAIEPARREKAVLGDPSSAPPASVPAGLMLEQDARGIHIRAQEVGLGVLLDHLSERSGIVFDVRPDVAKQSLSAEISAATWDEAVTQLLDGFNTILQRGEGNDSSLIRVWVLGRVHSTPQSPSHPPSSGSGPGPVQPEIPPTRAARTPWNPGPQDGIDPGTAEAPPGVVPTARPGDGPPIGSVTPDHLQPPPERSLPLRPGPPGE